MAQNLAPLPQPGLSIYPGYIATKPETFITKGRDSWSDKASYLIAFSSPAGEAQAPFIEIVEQKKNQISFKTMKGQERWYERWIVARTPRYAFYFYSSFPIFDLWLTKPHHGMRGDGTEAWHLLLKQTLKGTSYNITINEKSASSNHIDFNNKVNGADKGVLVNGQTGVTMNRHEEWKHVHRMDIINVAPGMDILLALGLSWIRADKQKQDNKTAIAAAS